MIFARPAPKRPFLKQTAPNFYLRKDVQGEKQSETKNAVFGDCISSKEYTENKKPPNGRLYKKS